jgi:RNA polymerase sigma-70 factor (ECF subfamily)
VDGYDIAGIAKISGMKEGTVKSHLSRGKEKMANFLRQNGYGR